MKKLPTVVLLLPLLFAAVPRRAGSSMPSAQAVCHEIEKGLPGAQFERDDDDNTWIFLRHRKDGSVRGSLVIELNHRELSILGVEGWIDEISAADEPDELSSLFGS